MFGLRLPELLLILLAVLLLFGGTKLPQLGKGLGESVRSFRKALKEAKPNEEEAPPAKEQKKQPAP
jgi:sec-independent protein translocase protein TatA